MKLYLTSLPLLGLILDFKGFLLIFLFGDFKGVYPRVTKDVDNQILLKKKEIGDIKLNQDSTNKELEHRKFKMFREFKRKEFFNGISDTEMETLYEQLLAGRTPNNYLEESVSKVNERKSKFPSMISQKENELEDLKNKRSNWRKEYFVSSFREDKISLFGFISILLGFILQIIGTIQLIQNSVN